jgi:hypothetical protein
MRAKKKKKNRNNQSAGDCRQSSRFTGNASAVAPRASQKPSQSRAYHPMQPHLHAGHGHGIWRDAVVLNECQHLIAKELAH